jgi:hypothetical protein
MTFMLVCGTIFDPIRPSKESFRGYGKLFHCPLCMGFWVGLFLFLISPSTELFTFEYSATNAFICGCISAGTSYLLSMMVNDFGIKLTREGGES